MNKILLALLATSLVLFSGKSSHAGCADEFSASHPFCKAMVAANSEKGCKKVLYPKFDHRIGISKQICRVLEIQFDGETCEDKFPKDNARNRTIANRICKPIEVGFTTGNCSAYADKTKDFSFESFGSENPKLVARQFSKDKAQEKGTNLLELCQFGKIASGVDWGNECQPETGPVPRSVTSIQQDSQNAISALEQKIPVSPACSEEVFPLPNAIIPEVRKMIADIQANSKIGVLRPSEVFMLSRGYAVLRKAIPKSSDFFKAMKACEVASNDEVPKLQNGESSGVRFALDDYQIQIGRRLDGDIQRFGVVVNSEEGHPRVLTRHSSIHKDVELEKIAPEVSDYLTKIHKLGGFSIAVLGAARTVKDTQQLKDVAHAAVKVVVDKAKNRPVAVITGGYKGVKDNAYGVTRAGFEAARDNGIKNIVIMPKAGERDAHVNVDARNIVGEMWGDDSGALVNASDAAIVFGPYGLWTEVEVANLEAQGKPYVIVDPSKPREVVEAVKDLMKDHRLKREFIVKKQKEKQGGASSVNVSAAGIQPEDKGDFEGDDLLPLPELSRGTSDEYDHALKKWKKPIEKLETNSPEGFDPDQDPK